MSAIDAPPGVDYAGPGPGELAAPAGKRRLARRVFWLVLGAGVATVALAARHPHRAGTHVLLAAPMFLAAVAALGWSVRRARVRVDGDGVRWGWSVAGFRLPRRRLRWVRIYTDAVALRPRRGSIWYLGAADWDGLAGLTDAFHRAGIPVETFAGRAPLWARVQSYGRFLDVLLVLDAAVAALALAAAALA